jgi:hypothetical protein
MPPVEAKQITEALARRFTANAAVLAGKQAMAPAAMSEPGSGASAQAAAGGTAPAEPAGSKSAAGKPAPGKAG